MNAPLRLTPVTRTRNAPIISAHTAVLATPGTLVTENLARVRKSGRIMSLGTQNANSYFD